MKASDERSILNVLYKPNHGRTQQILDAALGQGKVRFTLSVCGDSRAARESDGSCQVVFDETLDPLIAPLDLNAQEVSDLVAFLKSLTGDNATLLVLDAQAAPIGDPR